MLLTYLKNKKGFTKLRLIYTLTLGLLTVNLLFSDDVIDGLDPDKTAGNNPFNKFLNPEGGVNLFTGDAAFTLPLCNVPMSGGKGFGVSLYYSSNIMDNVKAKNSEHQAGWAGLGWRLGFGRIIVISKGSEQMKMGTYWVSRSGVIYKVLSKNDNYFIEEEPYNKVIREEGIEDKDDDDKWYVTDVNGNTFCYYDPDEGGDTYNIYNKLKNGFELKLYKIEDKYNNIIAEFEYSRCEGNITYPKEVKIIGGNSIKFFLGDRSDLEYVAGTENTEYKALDSIKVYIEGHFSQKIHFCYEFLNIHDGQPYKKRLLSNLITTGCNRKKTKLTKFKYFNDIEEYNKDKENYNLGALQEVLFPTCGRVEYIYEKHYFPDKLVEKYIETEDPQKGHEVVQCARPENCYIIYTGNAYQEPQSSTYDLKLNIYYWANETGWKYDPIIIKRAGSSYTYKVYGGESSFIVTINNVITYYYFWNSSAKQWEQGAVSDPKDLTGLELRWVKDKLITTSSGLIDEVAGVSDNTIGHFNETDNSGYALFGFEDSGHPVGFEQKLKEEEPKRVKIVLHFVEEHPLYPDGQWVNYDDEMYNVDAMVDIAADFGQTAFLWRCRPEKRLRLYIVNTNRSVDESNDRLDLNKYIPWEEYKDYEDEAELYLSKNNYCIINNREWDRVQWFVYTGWPDFWERWKGKTTNHNFHGLEIGGDFDKGNENHYVYPGNDFFAISYMKELSGRCRNERNRNVLRVIDKNHEKGKYHYHGNYSNRLNLGYYTEKYFETGYNLVVGYQKTQDKYRHPPKKLAPQVLLKSNGVWEEKGAPFSVSGSGRLRNQEVFVNGHAILGKDERYSFKLDKNIFGKKKCGPNGYDYKGHLSSNFHLAKLVDGSVPTYHHVVKQRRVYNGVDIQPRITEYDYSQSGSYYFWIDHCPMFGSVTATEKINLQPAKKLSLQFITGAGKKKGKIVIEELFVNKAIEKSVPEWKIIKNNSYAYGTIHVSTWPDDIYKIVKIREESVTNGLISTRKYSYSMGMQTGYSNLEDKKSVEKQLVINNDKIPEAVKNTFYDANRIYEICASTTKDISGAEEKVLTSSVTTWQDMYPENTTLDLYVPHMQFKWKEEQGTDYEPFDFDGEPDNQESWVRTTTFSKYNSLGMVLETRDGSSFNSGEGVPSSNFYGHKSALNIAEIQNAEYDECAFLTCDFDDHIDDGETVEYYTTDKSWRKGGSSIFAPPKKHFGDSVIHVSGSKTGPNCDITKIDPSKNYRLTSWVYPIDVSSASPVVLGVYKNDFQQPVTIDDSEKDDLLAGEWNYITSLIPASSLSGFINGNDKLIISVSSKNNSEFLVEDIRFFPENTMPVTTFYDSLNRAVCKVDGYNNNINKKYDGFWRVVENFIRNTDGTTDTLFSQKIYHYMDCEQGGINDTLQIFQVSIIDKKYLLDKNLLEHQIQIPLYQDKILLEVKAFDPYSKILIIEHPIGGPIQTLYRSECPSCGVSLDLYPPEETIEYEIHVTPDNKPVDEPYIVRITRLRNCWRSSSGGLDITEPGIINNELETTAEVPCLAYYNNSETELRVKYLDASLWKDVGGGPAFDGNTGNFSFTPYDNNKLIIAYSDFTDQNNYGVIKVKQLNSISAGTWQPITVEASKSAPEYISTAVYNNEFYVAYVADRYRELEETPPVDDLETNEIFIKKWNGTLWADLTRPDFTIPEADIYGGVGKVEFKIDNNGTMYLAYVKKNVDMRDCEEDCEYYDDGKLFVIKYSGGSWQEVGNGAVSENRTNKFSFALKADGTPFVMYSEDLLKEQITSFNDWTNTYKVRVKKFDGSEWLDVPDGDGTGLFLSDGEEEFEISIKNSQPFIVFSSMYNKNDITAIEYNGSQWLTIGNPCITGYKRQLPVNATATDGGSPYCSYYRDNDIVDVLEWATECGDANITNLEIFNGNDQNVYIFPADFKQYLTQYGAEVEQSGATIKVRITTRDVVSDVKIGKVSAKNTSGNIWSADIDVNLGENKILIIVTASDDDNTPAYYNLMIIRKKGGCAALCDFEVFDNYENILEYSPSFESSTFHYYLTVSSYINNVVIKPYTDIDATIVIDDNHTPSDYLSPTVSLKYGENIIPITVESQNKEKKFSYFVHVTREGDEEICLDDILINSVSIGNDNLNFKYFVEKEFTVQSYDLSVIFSQDINASITYYDDSDEKFQKYLESGVTAFESPLSLEVGRNNPVFIRSQNVASGEHAEYEIIVIRKPNADYSLNSLKVLDNGTDLLPSFQPDKLVYSIDVDSDVKNISIFAENTQSVASNTGIDILDNVNNGYFATEYDVGNNEFHSSIEQEFTLNPGENLFTTSNVKFSTPPPEGVIMDDVEYNITINRAPEMPIPEYFFEDGETEVKESIGSTVNNIIAIKVSLSESPVEQTTVHFDVQGIGTDPATPGEDFKIIGYEDNDVIFELCEAEKVIEIEIIDDEIIENIETAKITLTYCNPGTAADQGITFEHVLTIIDNDFPKVSFSELSTEVVEGNEGDETEEHIGVELDIGPPCNVQVDYKLYYTSPGLEDTEYEVTYGAVTFTPVTVNQFIPIKIFGDKEYEQDEYFILQLTPPKNINIGQPSKHKVTIKNDDLPPPVVYFEPTTGQSQESNVTTIGIVAKLDRPVESQNVTVEFELGGIATAPGNQDYDYEILNPAGNTLTFSAGDTEAGMIFIVVNDKIPEGNEQFTITLKNPQPADVVVIDRGRRTYTHTILDDDDDPVDEIVFVDEDAPGANNGTSWYNAYKCLQDALDCARNNPAIVKEIHVAEGTYYPDQKWYPEYTDSDDENARFEFVEGLKIIGGYPRGGSDTPEPVNNETILSGDIETIAHTKHSYHVVYGANNVTFAGFVVRDGKANGSAADLQKGGGLYLPDDATFTIQYCRFISNTAYLEGGAIYANNSSVLSIVNTAFSGNQATSSTSKGGAVQLIGCADVDFANCVFFQNSSYAGGAIYNDNGTIDVTNCTFYGNSADGGAGDGGAIRLKQTTCTIVNSIFWNNAGSLSSEDIYIPRDGTTFNPSYSDFHQQGISGATIIHEVPQFTGIASWNQLTLSDGSLCVNGGNNAAIDALSIDKDILGNDRKQQGVVDLGAFESAHNANRTIFFEKLAESFTEGEKNGYYVIVKIFPAPADGELITVPFTISPSSTADAGDYIIYSPKSYQLVFSKNISRSFISYVDFDDELKEPDETIIMTLGTPSGGTATVDPARDEYTRTIVNDDKYRVYFEFTSTSSEEDDQEHNAIAWVEPVPTGGDVITVDYTITGTATHGADKDYQFNPESSPKPLEFSENVDRIEILFMVKQDGISAPSSGEEQYETIILTMQTPVQSGIAELDEMRKKFTHTIIDCQVCRVVYFSSVGMPVPEGSTINYAATVTVDPPPEAGQPITVPIRFEGIATLYAPGVNDADYELKNIDPDNPQLRFDPGIGSKSIIFNIIQDDRDENNEDIDIILEGGAGYDVIEPDEVEFTILDDDKIIYVKPDGDDGRNGLSWDAAKGTIQGAIDVSNSYIFQIWVAEGEYRRESNSNIINITNKGDVKIYGGFQVNDMSFSDRDWELHECKLDGEYNAEHEMIKIDDCRDITIDGFTITKSGVDPVRDEELIDVKGGIIDGSDIKIMNCTFTENQGSFYYSDIGDKGGINNCRFINNDEMLTSILMVNDNSIVSKCYFTGNPRGAIYSSRGNPYIINCVFENNRDRGCISLQGEDGSSPTIANCKFKSNGNIRKTGGGAISIGDYEANKNTRIEPKIINCTFWGNSTPHKGGAISFYYIDGNPKIFNSVFSHNASSTGQGKHIYANNTINNPIDLSNCYVNTDQSQNWIKGYFTTGDCVYDGIGGPKLDGDQRLLEASPCINVGDNDLLPSDIADLDDDENTSEIIPYDLDHDLQHIRKNGTVDIGAYERQ